MSETAAAERSATLRHRLEYLALRAFAGVVVLLGVRIGYVLARWAGSAIHLIDRRHRLVARVNIRERFTFDDGRRPTSPEVRRMARDSFRHLAMCAVELMHMEREIRKGGLARITTVTGGEHVEQAAAAGRGLILLTGHYGNWELLAARTRQYGVPFMTVYRPLDNPLLDRWVRRLRNSDGQSMIPKEGAMRPLLRQLKAGGAIALLVDQDARRHGVFAPFFGAPASTIPSPAELALRTGAPIVMTGSARRPGEFRYDVWYEPPLAVEATGEHAADVLRITAAINARLEAGIRRAPEQWLWSHRRWKTQPQATSAVESPPA